MTNYEYMLGPDYDYMKVVDRCAAIWFESIENGGMYECRTQHDVLRYALGYEGNELEVLNLACCDDFLDLYEWERNEDFGVYDLPEDFDPSNVMQREAYNVFCELWK